MDGGLIHINVLSLQEFYVVYIKGSTMYCVLLFKEGSRKDWDIVTDDIICKRWF
jgi:hypothetical protein